MTAGHEADIGQHASDALCFYCASDAELGRAVAGRPHRPINMDGPAEACPVWTPLPVASGRDTPNDNDPRRNA